MPKMRLVGWEVRPVVMSDDGENLIPVPIGPEMVPATAWQQFKDGGDEQALTSLRERIESVSEVDFIDS